ncbi:MAG: FAD-dependent oxidoreductase [DPANN group archaeon]|nr:FAD-dependent oxidoreductase [DPANN group archaeon]
MSEKYDVIIIGGGPAGLSAAIYSTRSILKTLVLAELVGGTVIESPLIENYPGFSQISGMSLGEKMKEQAEKTGAEIKMESVLRIEKQDNLFKIKTDSSTYQATVIILALGTSINKLKIEGECKLLGRGVSYCATCDANFFKGKIVAVAGGGDSALTSAILLADIADKVYVIHRRDEFIAEPIKVKQITDNKKIEILFNTNIKEIKGEQKVNEIVIENKLTKEIKNLSIDGIFIQVGSTPVSILAKELGVKTDETGFIQVDEKQTTNIENVLAAGDITTGSDKFRQITTAVSEGSIAARTAYKIIKKK